MNIYVANIPWKASEEQLKQLFAEYGEVSSAKIIMDKVTQRSRGFGFIEMADDTAGRNAKKVVAVAAAVVVTVAVAVVSAEVISIKNINSV
jgi:hypothetical protein